ncbi:MULTISPECIES: IS1 family transposase [unclassified Microcoleus]|uniref:IS1 family transposase n=1 Tax=unclassified Microcoleus TaxID=2642155 RepID=UPI0040409EE6
MTSCCRSWTTWPINNGCGSPLIQTKSEIVGVYIGARNSVAVRGLWNSLPPLYCQCAVAYTDFWADGAAVLPGANDIEQSARKRALTTYIERLNNTLRPRVSRLVQKTLSFSKSLENHIGAIWYFIHHYNTSLLV